MSEFNTIIPSINSCLSKKKKSTDDKFYQCFLLRKLFINNFPIYFTFIKLNRTNCIGCPSDSFWLT